MRLRLIVVTQDFAAVQAGGVPVELEESIVRHGVVSREFGRCAAASIRWCSISWNAVAMPCVERMPDTVT
jgi:hypothetical protein